MNPTLLRFTRQPIIFAYYLDVYQRCLSTVDGCEDEHKSRLQNTLLLSYVSFITATADLRSVESHLFKREFFSIINKPENFYARI